MYKQNNYHVESLTTPTRVLALVYYILGRQQELMRISNTEIVPALVLCLTCILKYQNCVWHIPAIQLPTWKSSTWQKQRMIPSEWMCVCHVKLTCQTSLSLSLAAYYNCSVYSLLDTIGLRFMLDLSSHKSFTFWLISSKCFIGERSPSETYLATAGRTQDNGRQ